MKNLAACLILALTSTAANSTPSNWKHVLKGPFPLNDDQVLSIYKDEKNPQNRNGITVTRYLDKFDLKVIKKNESCHQVYIGDWIIESTIYMRLKSSAYQGKARFQEIKDFNCREVDSRFNTYEGTLYHEKSHFELRDRALKEFWKSFYTELSVFCAPNAEKAQMHALQKIETFLKKVHALDKESAAIQKEHEFYIREYEKISKKKCL